MIGLKSKSGTEKGDERERWIQSSLDSMVTILERGSEVLTKIAEKLEDVDAKLTELPSHLKERTEDTSNPPTHLEDIAEEYKLPLKEEQRDQAESREEEQMAKTSSKEIEEKSRSTELIELISSLRSELSRIRVIKREIETRKE